MNIKTVSVTYERKQNLGDFNSANVGCTIWADLSYDDDRDLDVEMNALWEMAKNNVKSQLMPLTKNGSMKTENLFLGLPIDLLEKVQTNPYGAEPDPKYDDDTKLNSFQALYGGDPFLHVANDPFGDK